MHDPSLWLFGGVFEVLERPPMPQAYSYALEFRHDLMAEFTKRLLVRYQLTGRAIRLNLETHLERMSVHSILDVPYAGEVFPGHDQIDHTLAELAVIVSQNRPDWRVALQHMKGVYVLHDRTTGEPYVGAAYGDTGIWDRLRQYTETLHGGNVGLTDLVQERGADYVRNNLSFALLEFWSMRTEDQHVIDRETYWKRVLLSRSHGLNRN